MELLPGAKVKSVISQAGEELNPTLRGNMENRFGQDFGDVRIHRDATSADSARAVNARAYTVGPDIVFGEGQYAPGTDNGRRVLAHELAHVVQQRSGPVEGTPVPGGTTLSDPSDRFEREADRVAEQVMWRPPVARNDSPLTSKFQTRATGKQPQALEKSSIQRQEAGTSDAGTQDSGTSDGGTSDGGTSDAGSSDAGTKDAATAPCPKPPSGPPPATCPSTGASPAESWIISHESGWNPSAKNPSSSAFGLGQLLKENRVRYLGAADANTTDCDAQMCAFRLYVKEGYRTAERAKQFWEATSTKDATKAPAGLQGKAKDWISKGWVGY